MSAEVTESAEQFAARVHPRYPHLVSVVRCYCDEPDCTGWAWNTNSFIAEWNASDLGPRIEVAA